MFSNKYNFNMKLRNEILLSEINSLLQITVSGGATLTWGETDTV